MKAVVVYYSLEGNTDIVARAIAEKTGAALLRLKPVREYPSKGFLKYMAGGAAASMKLKPRLANAEIDLTRYDTVILGTPVWAGTMTPPLLSFLSRKDISDSRVGVFVCNGGGDTARCYARLDNMLSGNRILVRESFINARSLPKADLDKKVSAFCAALAGKA